MVSNICGHQYINFYGLKKIDISGSRLFPLYVGEDLCIGNTCYPIRLSDILHNKILFNVN